MVATKLQAFGGMKPSIDDQLLPDTAAGRAVNTWLYTGSLQGIKQLREVYTLQTGKAKALRLPRVSIERANIPDSFWVEFDHPDTSFIKSPLASDSFERFYFASPAIRPLYNTRARLENGDPHYFLGVPAPSAAPTGSVTGGSGPSATRSYVYTWVTAFGEEGPPSPGLTLSGNQDGTWNVTLTAPPGGVTANRNIQNVRIYRTVTGTGGAATFFRVVELPIASTSYGDTLSDAVVTANGQLQSTTWVEPPNDLQGMVAMANGVFAAFRENEIWFSEPYRPHAWPAQYVLGVSERIVGLGTINQTLVVLTDGNPYTSTGINPSTMQLTRIAAYEPCLSRGSIVQTKDGVMYASPNGLVVVAPGRAEVVSRSVFSKDAWLSTFEVFRTRAALLGTAYYFWGSSRLFVYEPTAFETTAFEQIDATSAKVGSLFELADQRVSVSLLETTDIITNLYTDLWTDEIFIVKNDKIYWLDITETDATEPYLWRSKKYMMGEAENLGVVKIHFKVPASTPPQNPTPTVGLNQTLQTGQYGLVRVYADDRLVFTREIRTSGEQMRLPKGFKADFWQFEVEARVEITSIQVASSPKELKGV